MFPQAPQQQNMRPAQGAQPNGRKPGAGNRSPGGGSRPSSLQKPAPRPTGGRPPGNSGGGPPPRPNPSRPNPGQPNRPNPGNRPVHGTGHRPVHGPNRPPQWGRPPQNRPSYHFRPNDSAYLRHYYRNRLSYINRARRPVFGIGGFFPFADIAYLSPLPSNVYGYLPPPPPGYQMGYFDGYVVVYDPLTYFVANVIDLLS